MRGRAVTRPRAGPRCTTDFGRRPDTPSSASLRRAARLRPLLDAALAVARFATGRADFGPRVFDGLLADFFLPAALPAADFFLAAFLALVFFLFFLGLVVIRVAVSPRRAERAIGDGGRRFGRWSRWLRRRRRWGPRGGRLARRGALGRGFLWRRFLCRGLFLRRGFFRARFLFRCGFLLRSRLLRARALHHFLF